MMATPTVRVLQGGKIGRKEVLRGKGWNSFCWWKGKKRIRYVDWVEIGFDCGDFKQGTRVRLD